MNDDGNGFCMEDVGSRETSACLGRAPYCLPMVHVPRVKTENHWGTADVHQKQKGHSARQG